MTSYLKKSSEPGNEDTIQCLFFSETIGSNILLWEELCQQINNTIKSLTKTYIWHRDEFKVYIPLSHQTETGLPIHLCSTTCFGDNIEDEWFIVYVILEISKQYNNLIIQLTDNDGDFLLIEAANYLQNWANPENTENRVFIMNNHIHIIPPALATLEDKLEFKTALKIIHESSELTKASHAIEQAIKTRIGNYPEKLLQQIHKAVVKIPTKLASLLTLKPSLIAPLVNAYCNHDIIDAKRCKNIDFDDLVTIEVTFTKFLYAMLVHSRLMNCVKHRVYENDKKTVLGLKLMCGFQMIMNNASSDLFTSKDFYKFVNNLKKNGYFRNNIEGSQEYNHLFDNAKENFALVECPISSALSYNISQLMTSSDYLRIKTSIKDYIVEPECIGDNEDWLNINPEQLNELLFDRYGKTSKLKNNDVISSETITAELSSFLKQTSDFEGIEPDRHEKSEDDIIDFDSDQFIASLEKMLNILGNGGDEPAREDSDDDYNIMDYNDEDEDDDDDACDKELKVKLQIDHGENAKDSKTILGNIIQSMKEEKASTGPTSNLLRTMGVHKSELLDSDDDVD